MSRRPLEPYDALWTKVFAFVIGCFFPVANSVFFFTISTVASLLIPALVTVELYRNIYVLVSVLIQSLLNSMMMAHPKAMLEFEEAKPLDTKRFVDDYYYHNYPWTLAGLGVNFAAILLISGPPTYPPLYAYFISLMIGAIVGTTLYFGRVRDEQTWLEQKYVLAG